MKTHALLACLCLIVALPGTLQAETVELDPVKDNSLFSNGDTSNGSGNHLFIGLTAGFGVRRALMQFDVASAIPAGSLITSATLSMRVNRSQPAGIPIDVHRVLADWGEGASDAPGAEGNGTPASAGDATWNHRFFPTDLWASPGGDFDPTRSARRTVSGNTRWTWNSTDELVADVQSWLDDPPNNFGWILLGTETGGRNAKRINGREAAAEANRPKLLIEFVPNCVFGNVDENGGGIQDVLLVNGRAGDTPDRRVCVSLGTPMAYDLVASNSGPAAFEYVIWLWRGDQRSILDLDVSGEIIGCTVNPTPFSLANPQPDLCVISAGVNPTLCGGAAIRTRPADAGPFSINRTAFTNPKLFTIQALVQDGSSPTAFGFSISNAVIVDVK